MDDETKYALAFGLCAIGFLFMVGGTIIALTNLIMDGAIPEPIAAMAIFGLATALISIDIMKKYESETDEQHPPEPPEPPTGVESKKHTEEVEIRPRYESIGKGRLYPCRMN